MEIQIPRLVYEKVMYWVDNCPIEVSGFGKCTWYPETKVLWIEDAHLLKQEGGAAHTDIDAQSMSSLMFKTRPQPGELRWWWHSHVDMAVFWSGQDKKTIEELGSQGWIAATVFNKKREMRSAFGIKTSVNTFFGTSNEVRLVDDVNTFVMDDIDPEIKEQWAKDLADNVIQKKYTPPTPAVSDTLLLLVWMCTMRVSSDMVLSVRQRQ